MNPFVQFADSIGRETQINGVVQSWDAGNELSFEEALYGYTQAGASVTAWGDEIGSITPGKWADFVVLDGTLTEPVDKTVAKRRIKATFLAGEKVFPR